MGKIAMPINEEGHLFECEIVHISQINKGIQCTITENLKQSGKIR